MQIIMNQYICFVALWCLIMNTYIVFSSSNVKALEQREKKMMEKIIYFITAAMDVINEEKPEDYFTLKRLANQAIADTLSHYYKVFATK